MDTMQALRTLRANGEPDADMLDELIDAHKGDRERMIGLYERYKATKRGVPILTREFDDPNKINNKLNNDFFSDIVDTKVGYFAGQPIVYMLDRTKENLKKTQDNIDTFLIRNNIADLDSETTKMAAITGQAARLLYIDTEGEERVMALPPWECIYLHENGIEEPEYAMRYYDVRREVRPGEWEEVTRVEWYDDTYITYWVRERKDGRFMLDDTDGDSRVPHNFDFVPLVGFPNNEELQGDCEKVLALIDAYDRTLSDVNSEIEQFRLAYLAFYGVELDEEMLRLAKKTGGFSLPEEAKMEFITKMVEDAVVEHHLDRLEDNILRYAKSVNFGDEKFAGTQTGVALRYKMLGLENKCITAERKFTASLRRQFQVLASAWEKRGVKIDYLDVYFEFSRNFPLNLLDEAQTSATLKGLVSEKTRLGLFSFVDDVEYEMELMEQDMQGRVDLDDTVEDEADEPTE